MSKVAENGIIRDATPEEELQIEAREKAWQDGEVERKLQLIKQIRLKKLEETDWWVMRGNMSETQSNYRQTLRNIPQDYSEDKYDELLARDELNKLTHTVWSKP
tara:strand:+ start:361 stop:672 length:312 start_codon:yes stop_codon:yes gene_type:complete